MDRGQIHRSLTHRRIRSAAERRDRDQIDFSHEIPMKKRHLASNLCGGSQKLLLETGAREVRLLLHILTCCKLLVMWGKPLGKSVTLFRCRCTCMECHVRLLTSCYQAQSRCAIQWLSLVVVGLQARTSIKAFTPLRMR